MYIYTHIHTHTHHSLLAPAMPPSALASSSKAPLIAFSAAAAAAITLVGVSSYILYTRSNKAGRLR